MWPDRVSNPRPLTYESGALPTALRGPAAKRLTSCHFPEFCVSVTNYSPSKPNIWNKYALIHVHRVKEHCYSLTNYLQKLEYILFPVGTVILRVPSCVARLNYFLSIWLNYL